MENEAFPALTEVIDLIVDAICIVDREGRYLYVSAGYEQIFGYSPEEILGKKMIELVHPDDREKTLQTAGLIMSGIAQTHFENRYIRKDGQVVHIMWSARWSEVDQVRVAVARDITRRKRAEAVQGALYAISEAAHTAEDLNALYDAMHQIIDDLLPVYSFIIALVDEKSGAAHYPYHVQTAGREEIPVTPASVRLCRYVIACGETVLITPRGRQNVPSALRDLAYEDLKSRLAVPLKSGKGVIGALLLEGYGHQIEYSGKDADLLQFVSTQIAAAIERRQLLENLQYMALYDQLTGLPNRVLFHDRLRMALAGARRNGQRVALLYVDLDRFKWVNDNFGHEVGDTLLGDVARRLEGCIRQIDTASRFGGDEFVVLLEDVQTQENAELVADKIRRALGKGFDVNGETVTVIPSVGVACFPDHGDDEKQLLRVADAAMYREKSGHDHSGQTSV